MPDKRVVIRPAADSDLRDLYQYIAQEQPESAERFVEAAVSSLKLLGRMSDIGISNPVPQEELKGLRKWPVKGFRKILIFYLVHVDRVEIVRIIHGARDIPAILADE